MAKELLFSKLHIAAACMREAGNSSLVVLEFRGILHEDYSYYHQEEKIWP
jgi:hypothetical protein